MSAGQSYAVCWCEAGGPEQVGKLELFEGHMELQGQSVDRTALSQLSIALDEIVGVEIGRARGERLRGVPALVVERTAAPLVHVASALGVGTVQELAATIGRSLRSRSRQIGRPLEVVIAGGGVAGLEAMVALRALAEERVAITLVSAGPNFVYRPLAVTGPFVREAPPSFELADLAAGCSAGLVVDTAVCVDPDARTLTTARGSAIAYDVLLVAVGARPEPALAGALTFWDGGRDESFRALLGELASLERVVFAVPGGVVWPLPLYELALATSQRLTALGGSRVRLAFVTPEDQPLALFGSEASAAVRRLLEERGIELVTGSLPRRFANGVLELAPTSQIETDRVVSLPRLRGPRFPGLPSDDAGFLPTDPYGHVRGRLDLFAAGDGTTFPVKQGGVAAQQAVVAAHAIAAQAGTAVRPAPLRPVLRGLVLTGETPLFLRAELSGGHGETSTVAEEPLWWPPGKIAGRYLGPYLAARVRDTAPRRRAV